MSETKNPRALTVETTRRHMITGAAIALGSLAAGSSAWGKAHQSMAGTPSNDPDKMRTFLHQEIEIKAAPQRIYEALLDSKQFAAFTGMPAEIDPKSGGAFSMFGGLIVGRNIELVPNLRIVQAWREASWGPGVYSIVRFDLTAQGTETKVVLDHTGFQEGDYGHLNAGWPKRYWDPLKKYLA